MAPVDVERLSEEKIAVKEAGDKALEGIDMTSFSTDQLSALSRAGFEYVSYHLNGDSRLGIEGESVSGVEGNFRYVRRIGPESTEGYCVSIRGQQVDKIL